MVGDAWRDPILLIKRLNSNGLVVKTIHLYIAELVRAGTLAEDRRRHYLMVLKMQSCRQSGYTLTRIIQDELNGFAELLSYISNSS